MNLDCATADSLEIARAIRSRRLTASAVVEAALDRIGAAQGVLNTFTKVTTRRARLEAAAVDAAIAGGADPGPLAGVPFAVKDLFDLAGEVTLAGSKINRSAAPAELDATAVARLRNAGAVCVGAVNMGEYAYDFVTENAHTGATRNPNDPARSAGGSSGGSAAAVASGLVPFSLGSDTNGSIRVPASFCGVWGLKPSYGRLSRAGAFPFVASLDHIGLLARSVGDMALVYDSLQGPDSRDPHCTARAPEPTTPFVGAGPAGLRIAVLGGYFEEFAGPQARAAVAKVAAALDAKRRVELPDTATARAAAYVITAAEAGQFHLERLRSRADDFDPRGRDRLLAGALVPAAWYVKAQRFRAWYRDRAMDLFRHADVLLAAATPVPATTLGQETMSVNEIELAVRPNLGLLTQPISFIGLPVVAVPVWEDGALPIAVQLIAAPWRERELIRVARALELSGCCRATGNPSNSSIP